MHTCVCKGVLESQDQPSLATYILIELAVWHWQWRQAYSVHFINAFGVGVGSYFPLCAGDEWNSYHCYWRKLHTHIPCALVEEQSPCISLSFGSSPVKVKQSGTAFPWTLLHCRLIDHIWSISCFLNCISELFTIYFRNEKIVSGFAMEIGLPNIYWGFFNMVQ